MRSATGNLNHLGVTKAMGKSSLGYINEHRSSELFQDMYYELYDTLRPSIKISRKLLPKRQIFLLDSTTIDLCLNVFDWAKFRTRKGVIKLHTLLNFDDCMPAFVDMSDGKKHDITIARDIEFLEGSIVVADRGYMDFSWLQSLDSQGVFFVVRCRENVQMNLKERQFEKKAGSNVVVDWEGNFTTYTAQNNYPNSIRMVQIWDPDQQKYVELLTNNFTWTALITILLLKTMQRNAKYKWHLSNLIAFIRLNLFVKIDLQLWLDKPFLEDDEIENQEQIQITLF